MKKLLLLLMCFTVACCGEDNEPQEETLFFVQSGERALLSTVWVNGEPISSGHYGTEWGINYPFKQGKNRIEVEIEQIEEKRDLNQLSPDYSVKLWQGSAKREVWQYKAFLDKGEKLRKFPCEVDIAKKVKVKEGWQDISKQSDQTIYDAFCRFAKAHSSKNLETYKKAFDSVDPLLLEGLTFRADSKLKLLDRKHVQILRGKKIVILRASKEHLKSAESSWMYSVTAKEGELDMLLMGQPTVTMALSKENKWTVLHRGKGVVSIKN